ncbi:1265_t:CDS:2, partial [Scutellospora calospora]
MYKKNEWKKFFNENNIPKYNENNWFFSSLTITEFLEVKKSELDTSLEILKDILSDNKNTFKSLPEDYEKNKINNLKDNFLPCGAKQIDLRKAISDKRNTFRYKINELNNEFDNDRLDLTKYQKTLKSIIEIEEIVFDKWKNRVTPEFLNKFLDQFLQREGNKNLKEKDLENWLKGEDPGPNENKLNGYSLIDKPKEKIKIAEIKNNKFTRKIINDFEISSCEVLEKEKELDKSLAGTYQLPYVFNLIDFHPDKLKDEKNNYNLEKFAKIKEITLKGKLGKIKRTVLNYDGPGILPILTSRGKTTKLVRYLLTCIFPGNHIILVTPNEELAADTENHHKGWLQYTNNMPYKCVIHGKEGVLPYTVKNGSLASWINDNKRKTVIDNSNDFLEMIDYRRETSSEIGKSTLSILQLHHLVRYIACEKVNIDELKDPKNRYKDFEKAVLEIKEKLINKENTIIIFDESHFPNTSYQVIQPLVIMMDYKVLVMKKTQIFFRTTGDEYHRKSNGEEDRKRPLLKSGLDPKKLKMLEDSDILYVIFDNTNSSTISGITEGMPPGSIFIANINHEIGFTPDIDNVILTGETQLSKLGVGSGAGRVGRIKPRKAFLTTQRLENPTPGNDIVYYLINAMMNKSSTNPMKPLNEADRPSEAVVIGLSGDPKPSSVIPQQICPIYN